MHEELRKLFEEGQDWRMSWQAWRILALHVGGYGVLDDDSGVETPETILDGRQAKTAFFACTIGPAKHFMAA